MSSFKRILLYTKTHRVKIIISIVNNSLYALFNIIALGAMRPVLDILFGSTQKKIELPVYTTLQNFPTYLQESLLYQTQEYISIHGKSQALILFCIFFLFMFLLRNLFHYISEIYMTLVKTNITKNLRDSLHQKILLLPISFFSEKRKGDILSRITNDVNEVENSILGSFIEIIRAPIMIALNLIALFSQNFRLTLFSLIIFPVMGVFMSVLGKSLKRGSRRTQDQLAKVISSIEETLLGLKVIQIFNAETHIQHNFEQTTKVHQTFLNRVMRKYQLASPVSEFLGAFTFCIIVFYGGLLQIQGKGMPPSDFIIYLALFYTLLDPIKTLSKSFSNIRKGEASAERIFEILDAPILISDTQNAQSKSQFMQNIQFENVSFKYEDRWVIQNFNLTIPKGKTIALVGSSGSGKTTIANLITRFYDINDGKILIDNIDIRAIKLQDFRSLFGMVTQDSILFNDTIYNNMCLGLEKVSLEDVMHAAKIANAHEFISKLPEGYHTNIGEGGSKLSGGQKQRLSIARAVLHDNPILVLDEATSALDTYSERLVQEALNNMLQNRTSLVIAHRLSTIQNADLIVVLEQGKILEQGTHQELIGKDGAYKRLIELQNIDTD